MMFKRWFGGSKKRDELSQQPLKLNQRDLRSAASSQSSVPTTMIDLGQPPRNNRDFQRMQLQQ